MATVGACHGKLFQTNKNMKALMEKVDYNLYNDGNWNKLKQLENVCLISSQHQRLIACCILKYINYWSVIDQVEYWSRAINMEWKRGDGKIVKVHKNHGSSNPKKLTSRMTMLMLINHTLLSYLSNVGYSFLYSNKNV